VPLGAGALDESAGSAGRSVVGEQAVSTVSTPNSVVARRKLLFTVEFVLGFGLLGVRVDVHLGANMEKNTTQPIAEMKIQLTSR
jgi:hypothetical protein